MTGGIDPFVALARTVVEGYVRTGYPPARPADLPPELVDARAGVFVTLHQHGELRGCIGTIEPVLKVADIEFNMETAIPLGLIINELVTNSLKFAFPENEGSITIELENNNGQFVLTVADDGIGLPPDFDLNKTHSLGLRLVNSLVIQLDGEISMDSSQGAEYKITFRELDYSGRF